MQKHRAAVFGQIYPSASTSHTLQQSAGLKSSTSLSPSSKGSRITPSSRLLRDVRRFETDVSGLPICPIFNGQADLPSWTAWHLNIGLIRSPETSVSNLLTPRNNPEDGRLHFNSGGSLRSRKRILTNREHDRCTKNGRAVSPDFLKEDNLWHFNETTLQLLQQQPPPSFTHGSPGLNVIINCDKRCHKSWDTSAEWSTKNCKISYTLNVFRTLLTVMA